MFDALRLPNVHTKNESNRSLSKYPLNLAAAIPMIMEVHKRTFVRPELLIKLSRKISGILRKYSMAPLGVCSRKKAGILKPLTKTATGFRLHRFRSIAVPIKANIHVMTARISLTPLKIPKRNENNTNIRPSRTKADAGLPGVMKNSPKDIHAIAVLVTFAPSTEPNPKTLTKPIEKI
jgi:hypothetical protein